MASLSSLTLLALLCGHGALAQLGERRLCKPEVTGSIPVRSTHEAAGNGAFLSKRRRCSRTSSFLPFRSVECDCGADELFEGRFVDRVIFANVDGPSNISTEARIEESSGVLQRGAVEERQLHYLFVRFARTDAPVV